MPERYDINGNPIGFFSVEDDGMRYVDPTVIQPAVVSANRGYWEAQKWARENVRDPRERTAPYVAAGLGATMAAPFVIEGAVAGGMAAANSPTMPLWKAAARRMAIDLPAFEAIDRLPQAWGDERFTTQGTSLIKQTTPVGRYAPWAVDVAGPFIAGMVPGVAGDMAMRGTAAGVNGALAYGEGVHKRAAEAALRMGDAARNAGDTGRQIISLIKSSESPSSKVEKIKLAIKQSDQMGHISKQFFNKNTLNYIFNPNADPSLAYKMPFRYSGTVAGSENASLVDVDSAHYGDVIDQFLRKAPLKNSREVPFEELPEDLQKYFSTHYPGLRTVTFSDLGQTANPFFWHMPSGKMEYSYFNSSAGLMGPDGKFMLDPGHFKMFEQRMPDGTIVGRGRDVYKYHAEDFKKTNGVGVNGDIWEKLKRRGLKFIDSAGRPIVYEWQYAPVGLSSQNKTAINLDKITSDIVETPAAKYSLKDWFGSQSSVKELFAADNNKASLGNFLEASKKDLSEIEGLKKDITDAANDLGEYIDKFKDTSINNAVDNLEISAIMQGADDSVFKKIDAIKASMNKLKEAKAKTWSDWKDKLDIIIEDSHGSYDPTSKSESQKVVFPDDEIVFANGGLLSRLRNHYKDDDKIREVIKMARQNYFARGGFGRDDVSSKDGSKYYDIVHQRRNSVFNALMRSGMSADDAARLTPMIVTQQTMEGGWVLNRKDNNFGGMKINGTQTISYDSEDDFQDAYIKMLDSKWHTGRDAKYSWRSARDLDDWARILNREDLGLHTEADWKKYNKGRQGNDFVYLYAPEWANDNKTYRQHLRKTEDRTAAYLKMVEADEPLMSLSPRMEEQAVRQIPSVPQQPALPPGMFRTMIPTSVQQKMPATQDAQQQAPTQAPLLRSLIPTSVQKILNSKDAGGLLLKDYASGGNINIAPSKKGTFTAAAKKHGKSVQAFASQVLANKENYSPAMVKKANFARNFGGHKHGDGGYLLGGIYDLSEEQIRELIQQGYEIERI